MKFRQSIIITLLLIFVCGLISCSGKNNPVIVPTEFSIDDFPHEIGTVWEYQRYREGSIAFDTDTFFTRIDGMAKISDDSLSVLVVISGLLTAYGNYSDTMYWHIAGDTVTFYKPEADSYRVTQKLIFPIEVGDEWNTGLSTDSKTYINEKSPKTILDKTYQNSYQITQSETFSIEAVQYYSYVPEIGMIHTSQFDPSAPDGIGETWSLISFHQPDKFELTDFPLQVGASWTYKVHTNYIGTIDAVTVTIQDSISTGVDSIRQNWYFDFPNQEATTNNLLVQNKLFVIWQNNLLSFDLFFPFKVGENWHTEGWNTPSMNVLGRQTITTEAGTFEDTYLLRVYNSGFEDYAIIFIWIAKEYGIVKISFTIDNMFGIVEESWELTNYSP